MNATSNPSARAVGFNADSFMQFIDGRDEPSWLRERRAEAHARFLATPLPTPRDEEWRRTDIRPLKLDSFSPPPADVDPETSKALVAAAYENLVSVYGSGLAHVDGHPARVASSAQLGGAIFTDLATAARDHGDLLREILMTEAYQASADAFAALHAAFFTGGAFLYVPKGVKLTQPLFHLIALSSSGTADFSHTLVVLDDDAEATLVQETLSINRPRVPALHVGGVELILRRRSRLRFVNIQNWDEQTWHFSRERSIVGENASLQWTVGGLGSRLAKVNQEVALTGQGARAQVNGVVFTSGRQNLTYVTRQDHVAPDTTSDLLYKGGLKDQSRMVWRGMIRVEPDAQKTDAYQRNDNLILDARSRADSIPGLEIEANDVRCTHGATAGPVDPDMIFYAQSRGIDSDTATRLIVEGFFSSVYDRISVEPVRDTLREAVAQKLERGSRSALSADVLED